MFIKKCPFPITLLYITIINICILVRFTYRLYIYIYFFNICACVCSAFLGGSSGKESVCNAGDLDSIPGWGRSPGEGKGYPL